MIPVKKIVLSLCLILLGASVLSGCTKDEVLDQYNNIVQSAGSIALTGNSSLQGTKEKGIDDYTGSYTANYEDFSDTEYLFGGTSIKREAGKDQLFTESVTDEVLLSMDNKDETVVDKILKQFDLLEYKDRHPLSLSGGQKQRVAIASAIVSNREIIVFDEPTSGLDLKHMREVARSLKSLADQGKTLLVITHDPELVMAGCSYVVHMEKGQIKESYPLDESGSKKVLDFFRIRQ